MLGFLLIVAIVAAVVWYVVRDMNSSFTEKMSANLKKAETKIHSAADINDDGKVTVADAKDALDVNNDGKVTVADVKAAASKTKRAVKKTAKKINPTKKKK